VVQPNLEQPGERGMGIFLIRQLMDEVVYEPQPGANYWRLRKQLLLSPPAS
jgi:anti-sigma regulatory factor (Ser/Thr protein kinase)